MSDHILNVSIVTPQMTAFAGTALAVTVPGSKSAFQILYNHAPIISSLDVGVVKIEDPSNHVRYYAAKEGFVEVLKNNVSIVVSELVDAGEVDEAAAEADLAAARDRSTAADRHERERARIDQHWAEARIRAARLQRELA